MAIQNSTFSFTILRTNFCPQWCSIHFWGEKVHQYEVTLKTGIQLNKSINNNFIIVTYTVQVCFPWAVMPQLVQ